MSRHVRVFAVSALATLSVLLALLPAPTLHLAMGSAGLSKDSATPIVISVGPAPGYSVTKISATVGQNVSIELVQTDDTFHTFTLSSVVNFQLPTTDTPVDVYSFFNQHAPLVNISVPTVAGSSAWANFTAPNTAGTYEYLCENPGHFQAGMHGNLTVNAKSSGAGFFGALAALIAVLIIVIIILIIIAIVAAVFMRRRRRRAAVPPPTPSGPEEPSKAGP
jgi:plastocyanin